MSKLQIDLGYCSFYLLEGWVVQARLDLDYISISLVREQASCEITLLSAGLDEPTRVIKGLFTQLVERAQSAGRATFDLEEFFDLEFISELDSEKGSLSFQHSILKLCGKIIILANLTGHSPGDDDEIRQMLSSFWPSSEGTSEGVLTKLPRGNLFDDWDKIGDVAVTTGMPL